MTTFSKVIDDALAQLDGRGVTPEQIVKTRALLTALARERHACMVSLDHGDVVLDLLPGNPHARAFMLETRI